MSASQTQGTHLQRWPALPAMLTEIAHRAFLVGAFALILGHRVLAALACRREAQAHAAIRCQPAVCIRRRALFEALATVHEVSFLRAHVTTVSAARPIRTLGAGRLLAGAGLVCVEDHTPAADQGQHCTHNLAAVLVRVRRLLALGAWARGL